jgi:hypothetical protein
MNGDFQITSTTRGGATVISLAGELDMAGISPLPSKPAWTDYQ